MTAYATISATKSFCCCSTVPSTCLEAVPGLAELLTVAPRLRRWLRAARRCVPQRSGSSRSIHCRRLTQTLFVERARAAGREVQPDPTVEAICRRIDRLPLAVELAAARTKVVDPDTLLARLDRALPLPTGGAHDAPERQRTLRATIEWSYELLDDDAKPPFTRLSIFSGTFALSAAEEICAAGIDELKLSSTSVC